jgi:membrane-associated phospholipid phosphatase
VPAFSRLATRLHCPSRVQTLAYRLGPDLICLVAFSSLLAALMGIYGGHLTFLQSSIVLPTVILAILVVAGWLARSGRTAAVVRDWSPLILLVWVYENFHDLTDLIRPHVVDGTLRRLDEAIWSIEPTLALERITRPWLTEYMTLAYALYFAYPAIVLATLYARGEFVRFREFGLALSLGFYLGLLGYMTVPAIGPRYFMAHEFTVPLDGLWLTARAAAAWNAIESVKRDCFPSLHTALTTISLVYMVRLRWRRLALACGPLIVSLWVSTVYLRYHWFVDVVAGFALAALCTTVAPAIVRWYYREAA